MRTLESVEREGKDVIVSSHSEKLRLTFGSAVEADRWHREISDRQQQEGLEPPSEGRRVPEGVALLARGIDVPQVALGPVEYAGPTAWSADRGLQLSPACRAPMRSSEVYRHKLPPSSEGTYHVRGVAIRVEDAGDRQQLRIGWYTEEIRTLASRMIQLLIAQAIVLLLAVAVSSAGSDFSSPTGETVPQALVNASYGLSLLFAWPIIMLMLLRILRWPQLLRTTGFVVLAVTGGRSLTVLLAHLLAIAAVDAPLPRGFAWYVLETILWSVLGTVLCVRAWRLSKNARCLLPRAVQTVSTGRKTIAHCIAVTTAVYALAFLALAGHAAYQEQAYLLLPGVEPKYEQQALVAHQEGIELANKGDLPSADRAWKRSLAIWERLTTGRSAPSSYRVELARTLYNLGWVRDRQGHMEEAKKFYARAVSLADELAGDQTFKNDDALKESILHAHQVLAGVNIKELEEKEQQACRVYEDAQIKAAKGDADAKALFLQTIRLWEEILPQAPNKSHRKDALPRLATAYFRLGKVREQHGKRAEAEAAYQKSIEYGEKALAAEPDRPLIKHHLETAGRRLAGLREQAIQEQIDALCQAQRLPMLSSFGNEAFRTKRPRFVRRRIVTRLCSGWPTGWIAWPGSWPTVQTSVCETPRRPSGMPAGRQPSGQWLATTGIP